MLNKVMIIGNLGADPETRYTNGGDAVTTVRVATTERWKDKNGDQQERTEWHTVTFWRRLAEIAAEYLRKGSKVYVEGKLQTEKWQDKDGNDRYTTKIVAREMKMLDSKRDSDSRGGSSDRSERGRQDSRVSSEPAGAPADFDDDIPF